MVKIKFETGQTVNFEGTPTQADIEEVSKSLGIKPIAEQQAEKVKKQLNLSKFVPASQTVSGMIETGKMNETPAQVATRIAAEIGPTFASETDDLPTTSALKTVGNVPSSLMRLAKGLGFALTSPVETAKAIYQDPSMLFGTAVEKGFKQLGAEIYKGTQPRTVDTNIPAQERVLKDAEKGFESMKNISTAVKDAFVDDPILSLPILSLFKRGIAAPITDTVTGIKDTATGIPKLPEKVSSMVSGIKNRYDNAKTLFTQKGADVLLTEQTKNLDSLIESQKKFEDINSKLLDTREVAIGNKTALELRKAAEEKKLGEFIDRDTDFAELAAHALRKEKSDVTPETFFTEVNKLADENFDAYKTGYKNVLDESNKIVSIQPFIKAVESLRPKASGSMNPRMFSAIDDALLQIKTKDTTVRAIESVGTKLDDIKAFLKKENSSLLDEFESNPNFYTKEPVTLKYIKDVRDGLKSKIGGITGFDARLVGDAINNATEQIIKDNLSPSDYSVYEASQSKYKTAKENPILKAVEKGDKNALVKAVEKNYEAARQLDRDLGTDIVSRFEDLKAQEVILKSTDDSGNISYKKLTSQIEKNKDYMSAEDINYLLDIADTLEKNSKLKTSIDTAKKIVSDSRDESGVLSGEKMSKNIEKNKESLTTEDYTKLSEQAKKIKIEDTGLEGVNANLKKLGDSPAEIYKTLKGIKSQDELAQIVNTTGLKPAEIGDVLMYAMIETVDSQIGKDSPNFYVERIDNLIKEIDEFGGNSPETQKVVDTVFEGKTDVIKSLKETQKAIDDLKELRGKSIFKRTMEALFGAAIIAKFPMTGANYLIESVRPSGSKPKVDDIGRTRKEPEAKAKDTGPTIKNKVIPVANVVNQEEE